MSDDIVVSEQLTIPGWEVWYSTSRSSGAGGQHVNKTDSRVTLHWVPRNSSALNDGQKTRVVRALSNRLTAEGELQMASQDTRSQLRNKQEVGRRLASLIVDALHVQKRRRPTRISAGAKRRRVASKKAQSEKKRLRGKIDDD
ncbi:MAG: ribosome-associated protein [Bradymonadia bacterium]|jgi:ribosome-associated protein